MKILVGLGNPGLRYEKTRHNVGFMVMDRLSELHHISIIRLKYRALIGEGIIGGEKVLLVKPQTYMNLSGESIGPLLNFYKLSPEDIIVVFDDTSLPVGHIRIREKGSPGGHNGVKSLISHLGTDSFLRIKVGISPKPEGWDLADYVTSKFTSEEWPLIQEGICNAADAMLSININGPEKAMNQFNRKSNQENKKDDE